MSSFRILAVSAALAGAAVVHAQNAPEVAVTNPGRGDIHRFVAIPSTLRANQSVTLHAKVAGYLKSIAVDKGDTVKAGQAIAELEMPELLAERGRHQAELKVAQQEAARIQGARAKAPDLITPSQVDAAQARVDTAKAALAYHESLLKYGRITAPFAGVVTNRYVDKGAFVPAATAGGAAQAAAIVALMDYATIRVRIAVPEIEAARVQVGQPVVVTAEALPGKTFRGTVSRHAGALDETTRTLLVEADLPNADLALRPGMYAIARVGVELHRDTTLVPAAALVREKALGFLFLLDGDKAKRVPVKYGFNDGTNVEILEGLPAGARVILPGKATLANGQTVKAVEAK